MTELLLTISLASLGFAATLAAFGGEAWKKGKAPLLRRVTTRGWVSLVCMITAFILGIVKEVRQSSIDSANHTIRVALEAENARQAARIEENVSKMGELQTSLDNRTRELADLTAEINQSVSKPRIDAQLVFEDGVVSLINETDNASKNLSVAETVVVYAEVVGQGGAVLYSFLPGGISKYALPAPGVLTEIDQGNVIYALDTANVHSNLKETSKLISENIANQYGYALHVKLDLRQFTCVKLEYDDDFGNNYQRYLSLRVFLNFDPRGQDMHESRFFFDQCVEDVERAKAEPDGEIESWTDGSGKNLLASAIIDDLIVEDIARWKAELGRSRPEQEEQREK
jgi:hypothetical protein